MCRPVAVLLLACSLPALTSQAETIEVHASPVPLDATDAARTRVGRLTFRGGLRLTSPDARFGGLSDLHVDDDGTHLAAVTDQGHWFQARLRYDEAGRLSGLGEAALGPLGDTLGQPLQGKVNQDAESMALLVDGSWIVGFERRHRLWRYPAGAVPAGAATPLGVPRELLTAPENGGIEALATLRDGRLVALCEELQAGRGVRGFVREGRRWRKFVYPIAGLARPAGATGLPDGALLVLERGYSPDAGVTARLRRVLARHLRKNAVLAGEVLAEIQRPLTVDNFEGLASRRTATGETLLYLLSDDNFSADQRTLLLMFVLDDEESRGARQPSLSQRTARAAGFTPARRAGAAGGATQHPPTRARR